MTPRGHGTIVSVARRARISEISRRCPAPQRPEGAWPGVVGLVLSVAGAITAITTMDLGPAWYPIVLALTAVPCAWLGGALQGMWHAER